MKKMNNANVSKSKEKGDVFAEIFDTVFLFMHERYGDFGDILKESEINYTQYAALMTVYMHGSVGEGELAKMVFVNPSTMSRMVYALEERGWLKSVRNKADRRRVMVELSPSGKRRMEAMRDEQAKVVAQQVEHLTDEQKEYVYQVAEFVNKALRLMISAGGSGEKDT